jgi:hypothetical protein
MDDHSNKDKNRRFNFALFLTFMFIPFMIVWNLYGSFMLKSDYFVESTSAAQAEE